MDKTECEVCCEEVSNKRVVGCKMCEYKACQECCKRYMLSLIQEPHCMNCKAEWPISFLLQEFPKTWVNGAKEGQYRHHKKEVYLSIEKLKIPETLNIIEEKRQRQEELRKHRKKQIRLRECINQLRAQSRQLTIERDGCKDLFERREIIETLRQVREEYNAFVDELHSLNSKNVQVKKTNFTYVCPCPTKECRGLIDSEYKCPVCSIKLCKRCLKEKSKEHECKKEDIESVRFLKQDTKACPNCAIPIHRIAGCAQMWCTQCRVAFDWNTGRIEKGTIHNPHAIEWMRRNGTLARNAADVPCGGLNADVFLHLNTQDYIIIETIYRTIAELEDTIRRFDEAGTENKLLNLRIKYVNGKISEEEWKKKIFLIYRDGNRRRTKLQIYQTLQTIGIETFRELHLSYKQTETIEEYDKRVDLFFERMSKIRRFINDTFKKELPLYGCNEKKVPHINKGWKWRSLRYEFKDAYLCARMS